MMQGRRKEGKREKRIVTAYRQSTNVRYHELHGSQPHFWGEIDAGPFVLRPKADDWEGPHCTPFFPTPRVGQAGGRLLLGFGVPGTSIHLHSSFLASSSRECDFLHQSGSALEG